MKGGLSEEMVSDEGKINMGHIHICEQQSRSYKRVGLLTGVIQYYPIAVLL